MPSYSGYTPPPSGSGAPNMHISRSSHGRPAPTTHGQNIPTKPAAPIRGLLEAVYWSDTIFAFLAFFHVFLISAVFFFRKKPLPLVSIISYCLFLVMNSERINTFCSKNWESLPVVQVTENYFDVKGVFMATFFNLPLIVIAIVAVVILLRRVFNLMTEVQAKRMIRKDMISRLRKRAEEKKAAEKSSEPAQSKSETDTKDTKESVPIMPAPETPTSEEATEDVAKSPEIYSSPKTTDLKKND